MDDPEHQFVDPRVLHRQQTLVPKRLLIRLNQGQFVHQSLRLLCLVPNLIPYTFLLLALVLGKAQFNDSVDHLELCTNKSIGQSIIVIHK